MEWAQTIIQLVLAIAPVPTLNRWHNRYKIHNSLLNIGTHLLGPNSGDSTYEMQFVKCI